MKEVFGRLCQRCNLAQNFKTIYLYYFFLILCSRMPISMDVILGLIQILSIRSNLPGRSKMTEHGPRWMFRTFDPFLIKSDPLSPSRLPINDVTLCLRDHLQWEYQEVCVNYGQSPNLPWPSDGSHASFGDRVLYNFQGSRKSVTLTGYPTLFVSQLHIYYSLYTTSCYHCSEK